jgi:hypothetical protein
VTVPTVLTRTCPNCHKTEEVVVSNDKYDRWQSGEHVQDVWPEFTPTQREQLITGICSDECWEEYLGPEPEE